MRFDTMIDNDSDHKKSDDDKEISYFDDHLLEVADLFILRFCYKSNRLSEVGVFCSRCDFGDHLTLFDDGICVEFISLFFMHRQRLSRKSGLIDQ